ncbi:hypothetical protein BDFG_02623 [Blastomyces dermatitidis ATCC 26199]|nr:hypothetical protein BDFG_02623 [Blastomyces dermatitidis ATCC 26199]
MAPESHVQALVVITVFPAISLALFALRIFSRYLLKNWGWGSSDRDVCDQLGYTIHTKQGYPPEYFPPGRVPYTIKGKQYNLAPLFSYSHLREGIYLCFHPQSERPSQCRPVQYAWDSEEMDRNAQQAAGADENGMKDGKLVKGGTCLPQRGFFLTMALITIILDAWLLSIPSAIVWGINMTRRQKFMVVIVLSIGAVVTAFSIVRAVIVVENFSKTPREQIYDTKYTYANIETNCAIWSAATPALKSLIARLFPRWWETRRTPYPTSSNQLPHASSLQTSTTPLAGSWKGSQVASSNDPKSHPLDSLPPLRRSDDSEAELRRFEYDTKVSTLFRTGQNYIYS